MNAAAVNQWEETITEPLYVRIEGTEGQITQLAITQDGMAGQISDAEGNITALQATAKGLDTRITSAEGEIASLQVTASGLSSTVANQAGQISNLTQTVNSFSLSVSNGSSSSTIYLEAGGTIIDSARVTFTGMVTFADLEDSGATTINGDNITTGTIYADIIHLGGQMDVYRTASGYTLGGSDSVVALAAVGVYSFVMLCSAAMFLADKHSVGVKPRGILMFNIVSFVLACAAFLLPSATVGLFAFAALPAAVIMPIMFLRMRETLSLALYSLIVLVFFLHLFVQ